MSAPNPGFRRKLRLLHEPTNGSATAVDIVLIGCSDPTARAVNLSRSVPPTLFQHLPAQIPQARCLVYECDLNPGDLGIPTIRGDAEKLVEALGNLREATSSADRPLLLIGHSLGGFLVKHALVKACNTTKARSVAQCIAGVMFLGTPHPENARTAEEFLTKLFNVSFAYRLHPRNSALKALSRELERLETEFRDTLKRCLPRLELVSFYETKPINGFLVSSIILGPSHATDIREVVGPTECILKPFIPIPLHVDHEHLASFGSSTQPGYNILVSQLKRLIATYTKPCPIDEKTCLESEEPCAAKFHGVCSTCEYDAGPDSCSCSKIIPPHAGTVSWLCQDPRLKSWLNEGDSNKLWIRGGPGSGKSTLTKSLVQNLEKLFLDEHSTIIIHYFFDASQHHLDHATTRLLVSLLQQVSAKHADAYAPSLLQETCLPKLHWPDGFRTRREFLRQHLSRKLQCRSRVFLVLDGLDECSHDEVADVIDLCQSLGEGGQSSSMKLLFSSRPWSVPFGQEHATVDLDLENRKSASTFIQHELTNFVSIKSRWQEIALRLDDLKAKAEYNFLWLSLILSLLNVTSARDHKPSDQLISLPPTLEETVNILAKELSERYDEMLRSIPDAALMLSWLALAVRPLSLLELETALSWIRYITFQETVAQSRAVTSALDIAKPLGIAERLSESTGGMLRIFPTRRGPVVRLLHESVRDFLLQRRMKELHVPLADISRGRCMVHLEMARTCLSYMRSNVSKVQTTEEFPSTILAQYPFLEYAASSWAAHAKAANSGSISDEEFLRYFPWPTDPEMRLVGLASSIVRLNFGGSEEARFTFLHCAAYHGLDKPLRAFLRQGRRGEAKEPEIDKPTSIGRTPLHIAASMGHWSVVNVLLARGANVKAKDAVYGNSVLHWIALSPTSEGKVRSLEYLIQAYVDINDNSNGMAPLALAAAWGDAQVISALLKAGAHPNGMDHHRGLTALSLAIVYKHVAVVSQLLDANARLDYGDIRTGLTPLEMAIATRQHEVVFRLLGKGARVYSSTLQFASQSHATDNQDERMWLDRMLLLFRDFGGSRFVECPSESCNSQKACPNQSSAETRRSPSHNRRKRTARDDPDHHDEDENNDDHSKRRRHSGYPPDDELEDDVFYCCPYHVRNPRKFPKCSRRRWKRGTLHHILEHLKKHHYISMCRTCKEIFPSDEQLKRHQKAQCPFKETRNYEDGYDPQQYKQLHDRNRGSEKTLGPHGFWSRICHILFEDQHEADELPNMPRALEAYRPHQDFESFENFMRRDIRDSSWLRRTIRETLSRTDGTLDGRLDRILSSVSEVPGSFSERWRQQREDQSSESITPSSGMNVRPSREMVETSAETAAHMEPASERERNPDPLASQSNSTTPRYDFRQIPLAPMTTSSNHRRDPLTDIGPPPPPSSPISSVYTHVAQPQQPTLWSGHFQPPPPQAAYPMQWWYAPPPYNPLQPYPGPNMPYLGPPTGYYPMTSGFSRQPQHLNPLPNQVYAPNPAAEQNYYGNTRGQYDIWNTIRDQQASTLSSYAHSNMASNLGGAHTSATSQSQPEAFESEDPEGLLGDLFLDGSAELGQFPSTEYSDLLFPCGHGEDGDQEGEETNPPKR
ncbi:uncharacterized protein Z520_11689 [Fonsecaea multimorphosa CBS 102226]|uniref:NACHT domain-containing protein n=1 Tax=Fonsecaea multimorphosa CBS 102226 TaxID=1442371 RepID=A0A0D2GT53_9EURO|nr:uncharacterized protein Z520_11689 [Fonsecaea multimorphosa CBS 102226]KIX92660.1 hypothetical protein Z520_11689 [Fonsecaea multimorphosa CBS 102226]OAL17883.1 hypothetical protein AYO22_11227 [Fonsecaea multimorphosa]